MKAQHLVFYATDAVKAKAAAARIRKDGGNAQLREAAVYGGEAEPEFDVVTVLADVSEFDRARIEEAYGAKVQEVAKPKLTLPPSPPVPPSKVK